MKKLVVILALVLGYPLAAWATHESTTELHTVAGTTIVIPSKVVTDIDPLPHPSTVTVTQTVGSTPTSTSPSTYTVDPPVGPFTVRDGFGSAASGEFIYEGGGAVTGGTRSKIQYQNYRDYGLGIMAWNPIKESTGPWNLTDLVSTNVGRGRTSNGTAEACFWIGQKILADRLKATDCDWMGFFVGAMSNGTILEDITVDVSMNLNAVGVYFEHAARNTTLRECDIRADGTAVNLEWWYTDTLYAPYMEAAARAAYPNRAGSYNITIENCTLHSNKEWGIFIDAGNYNITIRNVKITGAKGIAWPANKANPQGTINIDWPTVDLTGVTGTKTLEHPNAIG